MWSCDIDDVLKNSYWLEIQQGNYKHHWFAHKMTIIFIFNKN